MATLIVAERARARGVAITWIEFFRVRAPVTLLSLVWGIAVLVLEWRGR